jgi:hypothetical protein
MLLKALTQPRFVNASLLCALLAPLAACSEDPTRMLATRDPQRATAAVQASIVVPDFVVHGMQLPVSVRILNPGTETVSIPVVGTGGVAAFDVWITAPDGTRVWQLLPLGHPGIATTTQLTLPPGGQLAFPAMWDLRMPTTGAFVAPGTYRVEAHILTPTAPIVAAPTAVMIMP